MNQDTFADKILVAQMIELLEKQKLSWALLRDNYKNLEKVKTKTFDLNDVKIKAQYNPARIISSSAEVTKHAIEARPCFLCSHNLPPEQKGIMFKSNFTILCNPYPIFEKHFTIAKNEHELQSIRFNFATFLNLSKEMEDNFSILYNGPKCGASAPDHMHFQAITGKTTTLENSLCQKDTQHTISRFQWSETEIQLVDDNLRRFVVLRSNSAESLTSSFNLVYDALVNATSSKEEPMMNMLSFYSGREWSLIIFPRSKHRPDQYFAAGDNKLLISPAAVDLAGMVIIPREKDFEKLSGEILADIYRQVTITENTFRFLIEKVRASI